MKFGLVLVSLFMSTATWADTPIIGMVCEDYWDKVRIAGRTDRFMDPIEISDLDTRSIQDLLNPAGEPAGIERGRLSFNVTIGDCKFSRNSNIAVDCQGQNTVGAEIGFRYIRALGPKHRESVEVSRSVEIKNFRLKIEHRLALDEENKVVLQPVMELTFKATTADGRLVNYRLERPFGKIGQDNDPGSNWGRHCSFITQNQPF